MLFRSGSIVGIQYTYIPKASYTANQNYYTSPTNNSTMNSFMGLLYEQTGLTSTNGGNYFYDGTSKMISGYLSAKSRYGAYTGGTAFLNGDMLPFTNDGYFWALNVHYTPNTGIAENINDGTTLYQNVPNPVNGGSTIINYDLKNATAVNIELYDVTGKKVKEVIEGQKAAGNYQVTLNTTDLSKGIYFYTLKTTSGVSLVKKMVISE